MPDTGMPPVRARATRPVASKPLASGSSNVTRTAAPGATWMARSAGSTATTFGGERSTVRSTVRSSGVPSTRLPDSCFAPPSGSATTTVTGPTGSEAEATPLAPVVLPLGLVLGERGRVIAREGHARARDGLAVAPDRDRRPLVDRDHEVARGRGVVGLGPARDHDSFRVDRLDVEGAAGGELELVGAVRVRARAARGRAGAHGADAQAQTPTPSASRVTRPATRAPSRARKTWASICWVAPRRYPPVPPSAPRTATV